MPKELKWGLSFLVGAALLSLGWRFFFILVLLHVLLCLILCVVILMQSGEAADLAGAFGGSGSQTAFGPRGAATFLTRATAWCAVMFMFTSAGLAVHVRTRTSSSGHSVLEQFSQPISKGPAQSAPVQPVAPSPLAPAAPSSPVGPAGTPPPSAPAPSAPSK